MTCEPSETPEIDLAALRGRYLRERDKRLRPEGTRQYVEAADDLAGYYETDPFSQPIVRAPVAADVEVAVLGGGFAGLIIGARLKQAGVSDLRIVEMGGDFGGTWYLNRYPGVQCDVESYTYMPLLEELGYIPSERYAHGAEIYEHCRRIGRRFGLYEGALFGTIVRALRWDEGLRRWRVSTDRGDELRARFVVLGCGVLNKPKLPGVPGIRDFKGRSFHTARWDFDYTGGDTDGGLTKLADKRVAVIGTGASGIQVVPYLARHAEHLYVFQRTPSSVAERGNRPTDPEWAASLRPGWAKARHQAFQKAVFEGLGSLEEDLICDAWGEISRNVAARVAAMANPELSLEELLAIREVEDYRVMERLRRRIDGLVQDPATAEALKPWYRYLCKRPCFNDEYLPTFNRPNVTLVDVSGPGGVERITEHGVVAGGVEHRVDCIIYASGFEVTNDHRRRFGIEAIDGRGGRSLYDHWADGLRTFHGLTAHGFPNLFFTGFTQNAVTAAHNLIYEQQGVQIAHIVGEALRRGAVAVEPSEAAEAAWVRTIRENLVRDVQFRSDCTPGYYTNEGGGSRLSPLFGEPYGLGVTAFERLLQAWRDAGDLEGMVLTHGAGAACATT
jgi:cyclohexanone monooxygenase